MRILAVFGLALLSGCATAATGVGYICNNRVEIRRVMDKVCPVANEPTALPPR